MRRIEIERITIDANLPEAADPESLREQIRKELQALLVENPALPAAPRDRLDGGELPASAGPALPRTIAQAIVRSLGGKA